MGEIDRLEQAAVTAWRVLPATAGFAIRRQELLGKIELYDKNLSANRNQVCSFCHMPYTGFSGPISSVNAATVSYGLSHPEP
jgi:cytochrome c peroxidase